MPPHLAEEQRVLADARHGTDEQREQLVGGKGARSVTGERECVGGPDFVTKCAPCSLDLPRANTTHYLLLYLLPTTYYLLRVYRGLVLSLDLGDDPLHLVLRLTHRAQLLGGVPVRSKCTASRTVSRMVSAW